MFDLKKFDWAIDLWLKPVKEKINCNLKSVDSCIS